MLFGLVEYWVLKNVMHLTQSSVYSFGQYMFIFGKHSDQQRLQLYGSWMFAETRHGNHRNRLLIHTDR